MGEMRERERLSEVGPDAVTRWVSEEAVYGRATGETSTENRAIRQDKLLQQLKVMLPRSITVP